MKQKEKAIRNLFNFNHAVSGEEDARILYEQRRTGLGQIDLLLPQDEFEFQQEVCSIYEYDTEDEDEDPENDWIF